MFQFRSPFIGLRFDSQKEIVRERLLEFKNIGDEECRRINAMSRTEVFEFIKNISKRCLDSFGFWFCMSALHPATQLTDNEIVDTIKAILMSIQSRLEGTTDMVHII